MPLVLTLAGLCPPFKWQHFFSTVCVISWFGTNCALLLHPRHQANKRNTEEQLGSWCCLSSFISSNGGPWWSMDSGQWPNNHTGASLCLQSLSSTREAPSISSRTLGWGRNYLEQRPRLKMKLVSPLTNHSQLSNQQKTNKRQIANSKNKSIDKLSLTSILPWQCPIDRQVMRWGALVVKGKMRLWWPSPDTEVSYLVHSHRSTTIESSPKG